MQKLNRLDARHAKKQFKQGRQEIRKISVPAFWLSLLNLGGCGQHQTTGLPQELNRHHHQDLIKKARKPERKFS